MIENIINQCVSAGFPELDSAVERARIILNSMEAPPQKGWPGCCACFFKMRLRILF